MITRVEYLNQFDEQKYREFYQKIVDFQSVHFIPAVRFDSAMFLMQTVMMRHPKNVLEIGFGSGASSLFIRQGLHACGTDFVLTTLERDNNRFVRGQALFAEYDISDVNLIKCDALDWIRSCDKDNSFDYIFLDAVKRDYIDYLPHIKRLLSKNGILIVDNTFFNDKVLLSKDELDPKYHNGVALLDKFNRTLASDNDFTTMMYDIGGGMTVAIKR